MNPGRFCFACYDHQVKYGVPPMKCANRHCANHNGRVVRGLPGRRPVKGRKLKGIAGS